MSDDDDDADAELTDDSHTRCHFTIYAAEDDEFDCRRHADYAIEPPQTLSHGYADDADYDADSRASVEQREPTLPATT